VNFILGIPVEWRLTALFLLGCALGAVLNLGVYRLAWHRRSISPWSAPSPDAPPRRRRDFLPVVGWFGLKRESSLHGRAFWVRPLLVELLMGGFMAGMYWWEVVRAGLVPGVMMAQAPAAAALANPDIIAPLHAAYASHVLLVALMIVVSLIDMDERIIPDSLTVPGTLAGLSIAAVYPWSLLPAVVWVLPNNPNNLWLDFMRLNSPQPWPDWLGGAPHVRSLILALACWWGWCFALLPRRWILRRGWRQAWIWFWARICKERGTWILLAIGMVGSAAIAVAWWGADAPRWSGLLTALVALAGGGGLIWLVRLIGSAALGREAMGFGDVTLMAMIGTFLGWQATILIFFLAPFAALVVGIVQVVLRRGQEIPYGPFLCLAALGVLTEWARVWLAVEGIFAMGSLVPGLLLCCMVVMGILLRVWHWFRNRVLGFH